MSRFWILNHSDSIEKILKRSDLLISIDPGVKNLAVCILNNSLKLENFHNIQLSKNHLIYQELTNKLEEILTEISSSKNPCLLIEKQLPRGGILLRIQQHIITYFIIKRPDMPIIELNPKNRSTMLKEYYKKKTITKKDSVLWVIEKLKKLNDMKALHVISSLKKKDDFADTICQVYSLFYFLFPES
jgi:hypothetical protein